MHTFRRAFTTIAAVAVFATPPLASQTIAIRNVTVIDGTGAPQRRAQTILTTAHRIVAVGPVDSVAVPSGARVIDGRDLYAVPGFIDMHAHYSLGPVTLDTTAKPPTMRMQYDHAANVEMLQTLQAFGITTIRNPGGPTRESVALRDSVRLGLRRGPRMFTAGEVIDMTSAEGLVARVTSEPEVRAEVARQAAEGVDYVKLYATLPPPLIRAGIDEGHRHGVKALAHLFATSWTDAVKSGIDGIVHITPGSPQLLPESKRPEYQRRFRGTQFMLEWFNYVDLSSKEIAELTATLRTHRVGVDPTLVTFENMAYGDDPRVTQNPELHLAAPSIVHNWKHQFTLTIGWQPSDYDSARVAWPKVLAFTKHLYDAGVLLTAGTDTPNPWTIPGASFHRELELLAAAGIPTVEVLRIATKNGAESLGVGSELGTLARGKLADLVLLEGDPLSDIRNTRRIAWVMQNGVLARPRDLLPPRLRSSTAANPRSER
jgi:imidazolonepropionase-like amidohydrolase